MERIAIYTCIINDYDELQQPRVLEDGFDFICYVGRGAKTAERVGVWEIRELPESLGDPGLDSRWPKMHPHLLLLLGGEHVDYAVYGLGRAQGVQGGQKQLPGLHGGHGGLDGFKIAHFAQQYHVGALPERRPERGSVGRGVLLYLALAHYALVM